MSESVWLSDECAEAQSFLDNLYNDPMTSAMGAPVEDIVDGYARIHIKHCEKCREATIEANMP